MYLPYESLLQINTDNSSLHECLLMINECVFKFKLLSKTLKRMKIELKRGNKRINQVFTQGIFLGWLYICNILVIFLCLKNINVNDWDISLYQSFLTPPRQSVAKTQHLI